MIVTIATANPASSASAEPAIRALRKIEAAVETGVTYKEYLTLLADVRLEQKIHRDSMTASDAEVARAISEAWQEYTLAAVLWEQQISFISANLSESHELSSDFGQTLKRHCPNSAQGSYVSLRNCKNEVWLRGSAKTAAAIQKSRDQEGLAKPSERADKSGKSRSPSGR